jgi:hypothetical protein
LVLLAEAGSYERLLSVSGLDEIYGRTAVKAILAALLLVGFVVHSASGQEAKNEAGFLLGSEQIPGSTTTTGMPFSVGGSVAFSFDYARRLKGERTALFVEIPFAAAPSHRGGSSQPGTATSLATLYVVPSFRLQAFADRRFSPWLSGGFGYGWLETSAVLNNGAPNPAINRNTGTAQFGGGVDIRTPLHLPFPISLRAELRDYYAVDAANYGASLRQHGQHDMVPTGGFVIHF